MTNFPRKIAIIGVGLIGGSIALGLKKHLGSKITIQGSCSSLKRSLRVKKEGIIDEVLSNNFRPLSEIELIIIATSISTSQQILKKLALVRSFKGLVIDVGSAKQTICQLAQQLGKKNNFSFIGTHPMAGKEKSGFEYAEANLFCHKPWIICPTEKTKKYQLTLVENFVQIFGAKPIIMEAKTHDEVCSWASHLCLSLSSILIKVISQENKWSTISKIAANGFRDTTRLASHNPEVKRDIILSNKKNIIASLLTVKTEIESFVRIVKRNKNTELFNYLQEAKGVRDRWVSNFNF